MSLRSDLRVLYHMLVTRGRGQTHRERMENFYSGQARDYDDFRRRLLSGREQMYRSIPIPRDGAWVDMGGGTGWNLENLGDDIRQLRQIHIVDLSPSLLSIANARIAERGWANVSCHEADATTFQPTEGAVDVVTFSYSLTMIPDWFAAVAQAEKILRPGGVIGVVDFYVSRKHPAADMRRHRWFTRFFWPAFFATDNVFPSPDHLPFLRYHFETVQLVEGRGRIPYVPLLTMPYYIFVGRKSDQSAV